MKLNVKFVIFITILLSSNIAFSQLKVSSSGNSNQADPSSVLELESTDKGLLLPRISDLNLIQNPAPGLIVFLTADSNLYNYTDVGWKAITVVDTSSLSNRIDAKLAARDTASLSDRINTKLAKADTASLSNRINSKLGKINDTVQNINNTGVIKLIRTGTDAARSDRSIFIGHGGSDDNVVIGSHALRNPTSYPKFNTIVGNLTASGLNSGFSNTFIGYNIAASNDGFYNTAIGESSLNQIQSGHYNTVLGYRAVEYLNSGYNNIAIGSHSGGSGFTSGNNNISIGSYLDYPIGIPPNFTFFNLANPLPNGDNQFVLANSLFGLNIYNRNNAKYGIGTNVPTANLDIAGTLRIRGGNPGAGKILTSSEDGTASWVNPNASNNYLEIRDSLRVNGIYIGRGRSNYVNNTFFGNGAFPLTTSQNNIGFGYNVFYNNTSGSYNLGIGSYAGFSNNTGRNNFAIGNQSLFSNTTGENNFSIGHSSLYANYVGNNNTAIGNYSLYYMGINSQGGYTINDKDNNTAIGFKSLYNIGRGKGNVAIGPNTLDYMFQGNNNVAIGDSAGYNSVAGNNNIFIGSKTRYYNSDSAYTLNIGNEIFGRYVDQLLIPNPSFPEIPLQAPAVQIAIGTKTYHASAMLTVAGTVAANGTVLTSDRRFKKDIHRIQLGLKEVLQLKPSSYYWNTKNERMTHADSTKLQYGFIAQELEQVIPAVVSGDGSEKDYKSVNYEALIPVLTKAIQEQQEIIEALKKRIETLEKREE